MNWKVLPSEAGHPLPALGWRLCFNTPEHGWVVVMMGHKDVMTPLATHYNAQSATPAGQPQLPAPILHLEEQ